MGDRLVSIIIPAYNASRFIRETIGSVQEQTYTDLEIIVVNDGSTDETGSIVQTLAVTDSRIKIHTQQNAGVSVARNTGFVISSGRYIAFLDADDLWEKDNIASKTRELESGEYGIVHSDALLIDGKSVLLPGKLAGTEGQLLDGLLSFRETQIPGPSSVLISRKTVEASGLFDPELSTSADYEFFIRVASVTKVKRISRTTWRYRIHEGNMHKNIAVMEKDMLYTFKKVERNGLFRSVGFRKACWANLYLTLAMSWAGDGKNFSRGFSFFVKAFMTDWTVVKNLARRLKRKLW